MGARALVAVSPLDELRARADAAAAEMRRRAPVQCAGLGCNGCCRGEVAVHPVEWTDIAPAIPESAWARVRAARAELLGSPRTARCPLLDPETGGCSIYAKRPGACRTYMVLTPREYCFPEIVGPKQTAMPKQPLIALAQAMIDLLPGGPMAVEMLGDLLVAEADRRASGAA